MTITNSPVRIKLLQPSSKLKKCGSGYILHSAQSTTIKPREKCLVSSGISMAIPSDYYGQLHVLTDHIGHIKLLGGVIDSDYRGDVRAILYNDGDTDFKFEIGDSICKIIFVKINTDEIVCVDNLDESERGAKGFGSTGLK
ncbi:Deoxyuridine 5'-triphosphate nucleotidohydrolase [Conglomerata obtusa]